MVILSNAPRISTLSNGRFASLNLVIVEGWGALKVKCNLKPSSRVIVTKFDYLHFCFWSVITKGREYLQSLGFIYWSSTFKPTILNVGHHYNRLGTSVQKIQHQIRQRRAIPVNPGRPCVVAFTFHQSAPGFVVLLQGQTSMAAQTAAHQIPRSCHPNHNRHPSKFLSWNIKLCLCSTLTFKQWSR